MLNVASLFGNYRLGRERVRKLLRVFRDELARRHRLRARAEKVRGLDLLAWGRRYLPDHFRRPPSPMHRWLAEQAAEMAAARGVRVNLLGPRGGAKSTIGTLALPLRAALERREPYIWIVSDTVDQAAGHLENLKAELVGSRRLARDFPQAVGRGPVWRSGAIVLRNGVTIESFGTGQRIRGRRHGPHRPTLIICDDLQNDGHTRSDLQRERSQEWFDGTLLKAGTRRTNILNLATALHRDALALRLTRRPGWTSRVFPAIVAWPTAMSLWQQWESLYVDVAKPDHREAARAFYQRHAAAMDEGAIVLWPEEEDLYTLMCMRAEEGQTAFAREKQNEPINPSDCEWPESYFDESIWFDEWPPVEIKTMALDPSKGSDARRGDYSALVMLGVDRNRMVYVEADLARRPTPEIVADGVEWYRRFRPDLFGVESNQFQDLLAAEFDVEFRRQGLLGVRPRLIENHTNKKVRIRRLGPYLERRQIRFKSGSPGTALLVQQLRDFPQGNHDDGPDAAEMAIALAADLLAGLGKSDGLGDRLNVGK